MRKMTAKQKQQLMGLLDWFFSSLEEDTGAKTVARFSAPDNAVEDLDASEASPTAAEHAAQMRQRGHTDASAIGSVPPDFVPTSAMNNRPTANGSKTDAAMVKRI